MRGKVMPRKTVCGRISRDERTHLKAVIVSGEPRCGMIEKYDS
jgi:hypothetical protein